MSADLLREAAAKMRERAEAATAQSGPDWAYRAHVGGYVWLEPAHIGMHGYQSTAAHIASWHPAVTLAVADWLDRVGADADAENYDPDEFESALAVARAYLGGSS